MIISYIIIFIGWENTMHIKTLSLFMKSVEYNIIVLFVFNTRVRSKQTSRVWYGGLNLEKIKFDKQQNEIAHGGENLVLNILIVCVVSLLLCELYNYHSCRITWIACYEIREVWNWKSSSYSQFLYHHFKSKMLFYISCYSFGILITQSFIFLGLVIIHLGM